MESVKMKDENQVQKIERIILDPATVSVLQTISDQISSELGDLVQVTQKSVANFIIRKRSQSLSADEMSEFLSENYDLIKALKHATQKAITAKHQGNSIEISDILKFIQTPSVVESASTSKTYGRRKKIKQSSSLALKENSVALNLKDKEPSLNTHSLPLIFSKNAEGN